MIEALSGWIQNIVFIMFIAAMIEFILPRSSMYRYVKFIIGLVIILAVITPISKLIRLNFSFEETIMATDRQFEEKLVTARIKNHEIYNDETIIRTFKRRIVMEMEKDIYLIEGIDSFDIDVEIEEDLKRDNFGEILKVTVRFKEGFSQSKRIIEPVKIEIGNIKGQIGETKNYEIADKIIEKLSKKYQISDGRISVLQIH